MHGRMTTFVNWCDGPLDPHARGPVASLNGLSKELT
jgi:hypothetical protein